MKTDDEILKEAKERWVTCRGAWSEFQLDSTEMLRFISGDQWQESIRQNLESQGFPAITQDRTDLFLRQITNPLRTNLPSIHIAPRDDADEEGADAREDLIRNIQDDSGAKNAYYNGGWYAAATGIGYWRVISEYESNKTDNQKLVIEEISDPNTVMLDPNHKSATAKDMEYAFVSVNLSHSEYRRKYGGSKLDMDMGEHSWTGAMQFQQPIWMTEENITLVEYYFKDYKPATLYCLVNNTTGEVRYAEEYDKDLLALGAISIRSKRTIQKCTIRQCVLNEVEVLSNTTWPGEYIPIVCVKGDEYWLNGKRTLKGVVERARDSQIMLNYNLSLAGKMVMSAATAPYIATDKQIADYENDWRDANVSNIGLLLYKTDEGSNPPYRDLGEVPIQASLALVAQAVDGIKSVFGIFDPSLGATSNEVSGIAIQARTENAHTSNSHWYENLVQAVEHTGCILLAAIPEFYDAPRTIQATTISGTTRVVQVNHPGSNVQLNDDGDYGVAVVAGPSYATKREESVAGMMRLITAYPNAGPLIADIIVHNSDFPGHEEAAARLRASVPPEILQASEGHSEDNPQLMMQLKQQLMQAQKNLQALNAHSAQQEQLLQVAQEENKLLKLDKAVELRKSDQQTNIDQQRLQLEAQEAQLEYALSQEKLALERRKLDLAEKQMQIRALAAAATVVDNMHGHALDAADHIEAVKLPDLDLGETELGGDLSYGGITTSTK
jgi:hypothetical protein